MKELSNCCKAQAMVDSGEEGTSCYMCSECKRPCDLAVLCADCNNPLTTEEIEFLGHTCNECETKAHNVFVREREFYNNRLKKKVYVDIEEYDRLKRLDENVKNCIEVIKEEIAEIESGESAYNVLHDWYNELCHQRDLLEGFYNNEEP